MAKQDEYVKTALRLPKEVHQSLTDAAAARGQSLNAEMVARLQDSFKLSSGRMLDDDMLMSLLPPEYVKRMQESAAKRGITLFAELLMRLEMFETFMASEVALGEFASRLAKAVALNMSEEEFARIKEAGSSQSEGDLPLSSNLKIKKTGRKLGI
jgi:hypothetical protein